MALSRPLQYKRCKTETDLKTFKILVEGQEFLLYPLSRKESQVSSSRYLVIRCLQNKSQIVQRNEIL